MKLEPIHLLLATLGKAAYHHKNMRKRHLQHLLIFFIIALMHFKIYLHQLGTKKQK